MITEERPGSMVLPGKEGIKDVQISEIEENILSLLAKKNYNLVSLYSMYNTRSNNTPLKDIVLNLEQLLKSTFINDENKVFISKNIFDTIKSQFKILETIDENSSSPEQMQKILIVLYSTIFSYLKKYFA
jgi:hypothetical protein